MYHGFQSQLLSNHNSNRAIWFDNNWDWKPWYIWEWHDNGRLFFYKQWIWDLMSLNNNWDVHIWPYDNRWWLLWGMDSSNRTNYYNWKSKKQNGIYSTFTWYINSNTSRVPKRTLSLRQYPNDGKGGYYHHHVSFGIDSNWKDYTYISDRVNIKNEWFGNDDDALVIDQWDLRIWRWGINSPKLRFDTWRNWHWIWYDTSTNWHNGSLLKSIPWRVYNSPWWMQFVTNPNEWFLFGNYHDGAIMTIAGSNSTLQHNPFYIGNNSPRKWVEINWALKANGKLIFSDGSQYGSWGWPTNSDQYYMYKVRHWNNNSELRLVLWDESNEHFTIYWSTCSNGWCGSEWIKQFDFIADWKLYARKWYYIDNQQTRIEWKNWRNYFEDVENAWRVRVWALRWIPWIYSEDNKDLALWIASNKTVYIWTSWKWAGKFNENSTVIESKDISLKATWTNKWLRVKSDGSVCMWACW